MVVHADDDIDLELWGLRRKRELFERVFGCRLEVVDAQLVLPLYGEAVRAGVGEREGLAVRPDRRRASVARHLRPGQPLVGPHVAGEAEHPLAQDVAHDLGRAALDGVGPGPQEHALHGCAAAAPAVSGRRIS